MSEILLLGLVLGISILGLITAYLLAKWVLKKDVGDEAMQKISNAIKEGAEAFMRRQFKTIIILAVIVAAVLFIGYGFIRQHRDFDPVGTSLVFAFWIAFSFILGAACSLVAGYIGMWISIRANIRTASGTIKNVNEGLRIALRSGAVSGLMVVAMSLLGVAGLYALVKLTTEIEPERIPFLIVGYGFGASFVALFAQLGGGIYTKAADVGADLVGKVEAGIPEDDPRNPAVIADLVGDNVGDCAGRGADLFESTAAENIGAMILAAVMAAKVPDASPLWILGVMMFPLIARAFGIIASIAGIMIVKVKPNEDPMKALNRGYYLSAGLAMVGFAIASRWLLGHQFAPNAWIYFFICGVIGILASIAFIFITQYYTEYKYRPVLSIAQASKTGPATNIITGISVGLESTALPILVISIAILAAYYLGKLSGFPEAGLFGTAVATMGMLSTAAYILAMDTFGPIADNAGGIVEMSQQPKEIREKSDRLDAVGNTTKALTKGYAIGSAALAAFLLFSAYLDEVRNYGLNLTSVDIAKPAVFVGALLGAMLIFLFSALAIRAVGRAAYYVINDVRAQFKEKPGILQGTEKPDYGRCVDIVTKGALKEMIMPGLLAVLMPVAVGIIFKYLGIGAEAVAALLMVGTITGILMATFLNNGGGAWDNAKKYIEAGNFGGKGSDTHKAAVVGDTVGDPFKDTAGPSLHVLIKLLSTITLVLAPLFI
ncbi:MAG: sodium-translocating pyrophosphatase [Candidatus Buchananbacteria bacterium RIFCSPHIGHO2_02_FULL_38_8]|uniref:K(+)-insensitive pyrophosphate-energized proton pump n=1 Tax=Candidatus Buchananbacteria bacterium RIFCSPHIGHO2_02_FULL_38_8 TaxID=1797538 RepID=A0A1G1Y625_9BACT|nr:MAG: sodium-translocating pyrophosphatase [Candidatus Buchananbacteria bacterium RIFCSPHIGHO2_02_FULL_38_8]